MKQKKIMRCLCGAMFLVATIFGGSCLTSCNNVDDNSVAPEPKVTLEDALKDGTIVVLTFNVNGEDFYVAFVRVGDTYELLDYDKVNAADFAMTRADEPTVTEKDCEFTMEHDKANNLIKFTVKEKKTSDLVLTAIFDVKESTMEVIPGDSRFKITGVKMKVSNVEITQLLKEKGEGVTLADALVKGAKVEIVYKWYNTSTVFTFTNNGGSFSCQISGPTTEDITASLKIDGTTLHFSTEDWTNPEYQFEIKFNTANNTFKFWTIRHEVYKAHSISVNGTDITSKLKEERA